MPDPVNILRFPFFPGPLKMVDIKEDNSSMWINEVSFDGPHCKNSMPVKLIQTKHEVSGINIFNVPLNDYIAKASLYDLLVDTFRTACPKGHKKKWRRSSIGGHVFIIDLYKELQGPWS